MTIRKGDNVVQKVEPIRGVVIDKRLVDDEVFCEVEFAKDGERHAVLLPEASLEVQPKAD